MIDPVKYPPLNLPTFAAKVRRVGEQIQIHDDFRGKYVKLTPEEWVRQHFTHYLVAELGYPKTRFMLEFELSYHGLKKRPDIAIVDDRGGVHTLIECKAPSVALTQDVFLQMSSYFSVLKPQFFVMTNGLHHVVGHAQPGNGKIVYVEELPKHL